MSYHKKLLELNILGETNYFTEWGRINHQFSRLFNQGLEPLSYAKIMERRLKINDSNFEDVKQNWLFNDFVTSNFIFTNPEGKMKFVSQLDKLKFITPKSRMKNGAILLLGHEYNLISADEEFDKKTVAKYGSNYSLARKFGFSVNEHPSLEYVLENPFWKVLAGNDSHLLSEYAKMVFTVSEKAYNNRNYIMKTHLPYNNFFASIPIIANGINHCASADAINNFPSHNCGYVIGFGSKNSPYSPDYLDTEKGIVSDSLVTLPLDDVINYTARFVPEINIDVYRRGLVELLEKKYSLAK